MTVKTVTAIIRDLGIRIISMREDGEAMALCPLHPDTNPSLSINLVTGLWNCYAGCGGGTIQKLVSEMGKRGIRPRGRGVTYVVEKVSKKQVRRIEKEDVEVYPLAVDNIFLRRRGFTNEDVKDWGLRDTGLGILIPIYGFKDELLGSAVRIKVLEEGRSKYSYNLGFNRNLTLFGLNHYNRSGSVMLVEGMFDVIAMHKLGARDTLGVLGTSLSNGQIGVLKGLGVVRVLLLMDNDNAGKEATIKNADKMMRYFNVYVPDYQNYGSEDPAEMELEEVVRLRKTCMSYLKSKLLRR